MTMTSNHSLTDIMNEYWPKRADANQMRYKEVEVMYRKQKVGTFSIEKY